MVEGNDNDHLVIIQKPYRYCFPCIQCGYNSSHETPPFYIQSEKQQNLTSSPRSDQIKSGNVGQLTRQDRHCQRIYHHMDYSTNHPALPTRIT